jgi:RND family efflux transporter MFP subunit
MKLEPTTDLDTQLPVDAPAARPRPRRGFRGGAVSWLALALIILAVVVYTGIVTRAKADAALKQDTLAAAIPTVAVVQPKHGSAAEEVVFPGNIRAYTDAAIYARTTGYLKKWYVDLGTRVKEGQLLAEIETPEVDQQLSQARADLATAEANNQLAQSTADRWKELVATDSVSKQETDEKVGDLNAKKAMVESGRANVKRLEQLHAFGRIYAPFSGVITVRNTDVGQLVDAGNSQGRELFHLAATDKLRVYVSVPQQYSRAATPGTSADLTLEEFPGRKFTGTIARNANAIDAASRTLLTEVEVNNKTGELLPGSYTSVHLKLATKGPAITIPANTLLFRSEGLRVAIVKDGQAHLTAVTVGRDFGTDVEIVSGLQGDESIVVNPPDSLISGAPVRVASPSAKQPGATE